MAEVGRGAAYRVPPSGNEPTWHRPRTWSMRVADIYGARWLPPLCLALVTLVALLGAYRVRPFVRVDLGAYDDAPFLTGDQFNAREIGANGPATTIAWPKTQNTFQVPGKRSGLWMITLFAAATQPDDALNDITVTANGTYLDIIHPTITDPRTKAVSEDPRKLIAVVPPTITEDDHLTLELVPALRGNLAPATGLVGKIELAPAETYRWSQGASTVNLPGLGRGAWVVTLTALVQHPDKQPLQAMVAANGVPIARLPESSGVRRLSVLVPSTLVTDGNLALRITSRTFADPRPLGVAVREISVTPAGRGPLLPPWWSLLEGLAIALSLYVCLLRMTGRRWIVALVTVLVVLSGAWLLAMTRYPTAFMLPRLAILLVWSVGLLLVLERVVAWSFRRAGVPLRPSLLYGLLLVFFVGYWVKAGGMLYPYFVGLDVGWHMDRVRDILNGRLAAFYGIHSPLNETTMPAAEWGNNPPVIPYSPWFHIFATAFVLVPLPLVLTANMFSALVDCSQVLLIALLGRKGGLNERESLLAALLYAITPVTFLLHSWGNIPTTFGLWWTLLCTTYIVVAYRRLDRPWSFVTLTLLLTITLLMYTVAAAFMLLFLGFLILLLWLGDFRLQIADFRLRDVSIKNQKSNIKNLKSLTPNPWKALGLSSVVALLLATLIYYGQYIPPILERTLPYFSRAATAGAQATGVRYDPFGLYLVKYWWRMGYFDLRTNAYGLQLTLPLGLIGMVSARCRRLRIIFAAWLAVALLFLVVGNRVSMVDKHLFYLIPALALGAGLLFGRLWRRGWAARLIISSIYVMIFVAALNLWIYRILAVQQ